MIESRGAAVSLLYAFFYFFSMESQLYDRATEGELLLFDAFNWKLFIRPRNYINARSLFSIGLAMS